MSTITSSSSIYYPYLKIGKILQHTPTSLEKTTDAALSIMSTKGKQRACLSCSCVQTAAAFKKHGCPNCNFLEMKGSGDRVLECTTSNFDGAIAMIQPTDSWVAKYQRVDKFVPGVYAARMTGILLPEDQELLEERGIPVRGGKDDD